MMKPGAFVLTTKWNIMKQDNKFNMLSFTGKMKIHLSWMALFITFVVWFKSRTIAGFDRQITQYQHGGS